MALSGTVNANKDAAQGYQSLMMVAIYPPGAGSPVLWSSHSFDGTTGPTFPAIGPLPSGVYEGRISQQSLNGLQHRSNLGIDRISLVNLEIFDADHSVYNNIAKVYGFRGATIKMAVVLWEAGTSNFTSDAIAVFTGVCDMELPGKGLTTIRLSANTSHNMAVTKMPNFPNENRCPLHFPANHAERLLSADPNSDFCIYTREVGGSGLGNLGPANHTNIYGDVVTDANGVYIACEFLRSSPSDNTVGCMARLGDSALTNIAPDGDIGHDQAGNWTGGFAGIQWNPGVYYATDKNYVNNSRVATFKFLNAAVLGTYQNLVYGQQFINAKIATIVESGNDTKMEAMIYAGEHDLGYTPFPVVNGVEVNRFGHGNVDGSLGWDWANDGTNTSTGGRRGTPLRFVGYTDDTHSALGDPFGSICRMGIVVYSQLFTGFGIPTVQVRTIGPKVAVYTSPTSFTMLGYPYNANSVWVVLDILKRSNYDISELSIQTFIDCALICDVSIGYIDQSGASVTHARFKSQFSLETRKTAGELLTGVLRGFRGYTYYDSAGLLCVGIDQTLADQQGSLGLVPGTNHTGSVSSITALGGAATGFVAYAFDDTNINLKTLSGEGNATIQTPNRINVSFQDEENSFVVNSINIVDPNAVNRAGGSLNPGGSIIDESLNVEGLSNFDQCARIINPYLAERQYGNENNVPLGTRIFKFQTTTRVVSVRTGHLVFFSSIAYGITLQLFRVLNIQPSTDYQTAEVTIQWHNDIWYTDAYGQAPQAFYSNAGLAKSPRPPLPWQPYQEQPQVPAGDVFPLVSSTEWNFAVAEIDGLDANGKALVQLQITGNLPVNQINASTQPPRVPTQATLGSGGSIPAGLIVYIKICAVDANSLYTTPSQTIVSPVTTGSNTITISGIGWPAGAVSYDLFAGFDHFSITHQVSAAISGTTVTFSAMPNVRAYAPPDVNAASVFGQAKLVIHEGIVGSNVGATHAGPNTVTIGGPQSGTFTNAFTGYKLVLIGRPTLAGAPLQIIEFTCSHGSGDGNVITVDRDPTGLLDIQDVVIISAQANIHSPTTIGDVNLVSAYAPFGVSPDGTAQPDIGSVIRIVAGKGRYQSRTIIGVTASTGGTNWDTYVVGKQWTTEPDATSQFIVEESSWPDNTPVTDYTVGDYRPNNVALINTTNYAKKTVLVQALIGDASDTLFANERRSPFRILYLTGSQGTRIITADTTQSITDGIIQVDTTAGNVTIQLLSYIFVPNVELLIQKISADANVVIINWATGEQDWNGDSTRQLTSNADPNNKTDIIFPGT